MRISHRKELNSQPAPQVQYVDRIVETRVEVPVEKTVIQREVEMKEVDLKPMHAKHEELTHKLLALDVKHCLKHNELTDQFDAQSRAMVTMIAERQLERTRRLQLIKKFKRERDAHQKAAWQFKLIAGLSLVISLLSLIIR